MERDEADDVKELLAYPEDTAGGLMTTEFVAVRDDLTADADHRAAARAGAGRRDDLLPLRDRRRRRRLVGVLSLRDLIVAQPETPVARRHVSTTRSRWASSPTRTRSPQMVARYNLLAVPVVDDERPSGRASSPSTTPSTPSCPAAGGAASRASSARRP